MKFYFAKGMRVLVGVVAAIFLHGCNDATSSDTAKLTVSIPHASSSNKIASRAVMPNYIHAVTVSVFDGSQRLVAKGDIPASGGELALTVPPNTALHVTAAALDQENQPRFSGNKDVPPIASGTTSTVALTLDALSPLSTLVQPAELGTLSVADGTTDVIVIATNAKADQIVRFDITGGDDQSFFNIDAMSGLLSFNTALKSTEPQDKNLDNVYEVQVTFNDGFEYVSQDLKVAVGYLDVTFGKAGIVTQDFSGSAVSSDSASAVVVQPDGKIVVAGTTSTGSVLVRYNINGSVDTDFGTQSNARLNGTITAMALQSNGDIVVAGTSTNNAGNRDFLLARYDKNGNIDISFGGNESGVVMTDIENGSDDVVAALVIQADGKIVVVGYMEILPPILAVTATGRYFAVVRYDANGVPDTTFGPNNSNPISTGIVVTNIPGYTNGEATAVTLQNDTPEVSGKIVVAGYATSSITGNDFVVIRYDNAGFPDSTFNTNGVNTETSSGIVITEFTSSDDQATAVVIQPDGTLDGKIVAVGGIRGGGFALARFSNDGSLDKNFGINGDGKVTDDINFANAVVLQSDGKIVVGGYEQCDCSGFFVLARYEQDGRLDMGFGTNGVITTYVSNNGGGVPKALALQPDHKIVAVGTMFDNASDTGNDFAIVRYQSIR